MGGIVINPKVEKQEYMSLDEFDTIDLDVSAGNIEIVQGKEFAIEYSLYWDVKCEVLYIPDNAVIDLKNIDAGIII